MSSEMRGNAEVAGVKVKEAPIETLGTTGSVERYQAPLWSAYDKVRNQLSRDYTEKECLKMELFAINTTIGPEGLYRMFPVRNA